MAAICAFPGKVMQTRLQSRHKQLTFEHRRCRRLSLSPGPPAPAPPSPPPAPPFSTSSLIFSYILKVLVVGSSARLPLARLSKRQRANI